MSFVVTPADPLPPGAKVEFLTASDGTSFRVARFAGDDTSRGTCVVLNGRSEFIEKYFEVIGDVISRGYAVATLDWRGQGLSDRPLDNRHKGHVEHFDRYVEDLHHAFTTFIQPNCPGPYRAMAHSMGGNITLRHLAKHPGTFESCVFSAPMWGIGKAARTPWWARGLSTVLNGVGKGDDYVPMLDGDYGESSVKFEGNVLTHDETRFRRAVAQVAAEPRLELGSPTIGWFGQAIESMDLVHSDGFAESIETPIRVCSATADALVSVDAQRLVADRLPNGKQVIVEGAKHELLMEIDEYRAQIFAAFDELT